MFLARFLSIFSSSPSSSFLLSLLLLLLRFISLSSLSLPPHPPCHQNSFRTCSTLVTFLSQHQHFLLIFFTSPNFNFPPSPSLSFLFPYLLVAILLPPRHFTVFSLSSSFLEFFLVFFLLFPFLAFSILVNLWFFLSPSFNLFAVFPLPSFS